MGTLTVSLTVLLAAGCATMPDNGQPETVRPPQGQGVQVRVIPMPPRDGQSPREVLQNFLDASIADEADYRTAKQYLTPDAIAQWRPNDGAVVLATTALQAPAGGDSADQVQLTISSHEVGELDSRHTYHGKDDRAQYSGQFTLVNVAKDAKDSKDAKDRAQWRIAALPSTLVLDKTSFQNAYQLVERYFFTRNDPVGGGAQPVLVPDPVYLRRRIDPAGAAAQAVAQGASGWLAPVVRSGFDGGVSVTAVSSDDPRTVRVQVDGVDCVTSERQCRQMAAQLYYTLLSQGGPGSVDRVQVVAKKGSAEVTTTQAKAAAYAPGTLAGSGQAYARDAKTGQLETLSQGSSGAVPGVLGSTSPGASVEPSGDQAPAAFAVRRDRPAAAVVSQDGRALYQVALDDSAKQLGQPVATSRVAQGLATPSWDGFGGLWVVDRDPAQPQVLLIKDGARTSVPVADLPAGQAVDGLRVSSDGTRVALLLKDAAGNHGLWLGLVRRDDPQQASNVQISGLRPIAALLTDVTSVSWADPDTLLVLGKERDSVPQLRYVSTDGYSGLDTALQAVDGTTVVAASESRLDPVLADAKGGDHLVYSLSGTMQPQWKAFAKDATQPTYPG
ncbi:LpqB family beta-propeller domain-containing protein [Kitasatospora sp. NPDC058965]|uniref:LpqB family beta-propeller domain-containing protein n=1 Tax=Kitasatospora sp. NPDC058965 TaxID=3346682 RepID=UPI00369D21D4